MSYFPPGFSLSLSQFGAFFSPYWSLIVVWFDLIGRQRRCQWNINRWLTSREFNHGPTTRRRKSCQIDSPKNWRVTRGQTNEHRLPPPIKNLRIELHLVRRAGPFITQLIVHLHSWNFSPFTFDYWGVMCYYCSYFCIFFFKILAEYFMRVMVGFLTNNLTRALTGLRS